MVTRDPDHVQEPDGAARARDHADALLRQPDDGGLGDDPEVAREAELEGDPEAVSADSRDDRLAAAFRGGDVAGELGDVLRASLEEPRDLAAAREVLALGPEHHDTHLRVPVELLEHEAELVALGHPHDVEGRAVEHHVRPLALGVDLHPEAVEPLDDARDGAPEDSLHVVVLPFVTLAMRSAQSSASYSPATSRRRRILPTGISGSRAGTCTPSAA